MRKPSPALRRLWTEQALPVSAASKALLRWLAPLIATGVVERVRSGVGERLLLRQPLVLTRYIDQCFPGGLDAPAPESRAQAVMWMRDSRLVAPDAPAVVLLRGLEGAVLLGPRGAIDLALATRRHGAFALAVRDLSRYRLQGAVAVIENREAFFHAEALGAWGLPAHSFVLGNGRLSTRLRSWLSTQTAQDPALDLWHCGDYDASGLSDYLALRADGARVRLLVPDKLEPLLARYGKRSLHISSPELERLRIAHPDPVVEHIATLLSRHGAGLEQEVLLSTDHG